MSIVMKIIHKFTHKKFDKTNMKFSSTLNLTNAGIASKNATLLFVSSKSSFL